MHTSSSRFGARSALSTPQSTAEVLFEFVRYFGASFAALAVDLATFSIAIRAVGLSWPVAAALGFVLGMMIAYILSVRYVFSKRTLGQRPWLEFINFLVIGLFGLAVTQAVLWITIDGIGLSPELSKLLAAGITFTFNFVVRKVLLFTRQH